MTLLAHSATAYRQLGQLLAVAAGMPKRQLREAYESLFMSTMSRIATAPRHTNVLMHMADHLERLVDAGSRRELVDSIDEYRRGLAPLVVPLALIRHHVRVHDVAYLAGQAYLEPHPRELMLRNHV
jgi:uncharacterized protein YbgA (DUF1722 family)